MYIYTYIYIYIYVYILPSGRSKTERRYRGTSLTRKRSPLGPYRGPMPRVLGGPGGVGFFIWARYPCTLRSTRALGIGLQ